MSRRTKDISHLEELNVWPSFTDLMSNAFMILSFFLLLALFKSLFLKYTAEESQANLSQSEQIVSNLERKISILENRLQGKNRQLRQLQQDNRSLVETLTANQQQVTSLREEVKQVASLREEVTRLRLAPPVVVIENSGEYQFQSGSAQLPPNLGNYIETQLVDKIEQITQERGIYVVEIIGHTDGQINVSGSSNLDQQLEEVAVGNKSLSSLTPGSNADLGLMRALVVVQSLQQLQSQGRLQGLEFRAYSAAQLLTPSGGFAPPNRQADAQRRRIEIRFSPLGEAETIR